MKVALGIALGMVLLLGVFHIIGIPSIITTLLNADLFYLLLALIATLTILVCHTFRLRLILSSQKYQLSFKNALKIHASSNTINMLTPVVKAGGIPLKVHYLSKTNIPPAPSCASILGETAIETISFFSTLIMLTITLSLTHRLPIMYAYLGLAIAGLVMIGIFFFSKIVFSQKRIEHIIKKYVLRFTTVDAKSTSKVFKCSIKSFLSDWALCSKAFAISLFCRGLEFTRIFCVFYALGFNAGLGIVLTVWVVESFLSGVPWLPGGIGLVEGGTISILALLKLPIAMASTFILVDRIIGLWIPILIGTFAAAQIKRNGIKQMPS